MAPAVVVWATARQSSPCLRQEASSTPITAGLLGRVAADQVCPPSCVTLSCGPPVEVVPEAMQLLVELQSTRWTWPVPAGRLPPPLQMAPRSVLVEEKT